MGRDHREEAGTRLWLGQQRERTGHGLEEGAGTRLWLGLEAGTGLSVEEHTHRKALSKSQTPGPAAGCTPLEGLVEGRGGAR